MALVKRNSFPQGALSAIAVLAFFNPSLGAVDLVPFGAEWAYMHPTDGVDPALSDPDFDTTWFLSAAEFAANYNGPEIGRVPAETGPPFDTGVGMAPLGYGSVTYISNVIGGWSTVLTEPEAGMRRTAYFRHAFTVDKEVERLALDIIADDGAVIYLDGQRLLDVNFEGGDTFTAETVGGANENLLRVFTVGLGGLDAGDHVLAVSVHQTGPDSSDLGFDLRLSDEGAAAHTLALADFDGTVAPVFVEGGINAWQNIQPGEFLLNNGDGGTVMTGLVDLTGRTEVIFAMRLQAEESSGSTNFEEDDRFLAKLVLADDTMAVTEMSLIPAAFDTDGDGALSGSEFGPGKEPSKDVEIDRFLTARIPEGTVKAQLVVEAVNDSNTEEFTISEARFFEGVVMGTVDFGEPGSLFLLQGPNNWIEEQQGSFRLNDADGGVLISDVVDLSNIRNARINLDFNASETSAASNFENGDTFEAWLEITNRQGLVWQLELADLGGDAFAPGADPSEMVSFDLEIVAPIPDSAIAAQLYVDADNNSPSETFAVSSILFTGIPFVEADFRILAVEVAGNGKGWEIRWESEAGFRYDLEFSSDLSLGSFVRVGSVTATESVTTASYDPGVAGGYFRVVKHIP